MIEVRHLTKTYGSATVVDDLSFEVRPGVVTGFLGPNGAGKSTTMRMMLGLDRPTSGDALIDGVPYRELSRPLTKVGALLDARWTHEKRSARAHLSWLAAANGIPRTRVDEVLELVGLSQAARKKTGTFSLGMSQRLGLAAALLGDPKYLLFDEPVNGLDPEGIVWIRQVMRRLAGEGRTVFVSSHLLSEMAHTADHLVVIAAGRLVADCSVSDFVGTAAVGTVRVRARGLDALRTAVLRAGATSAEVDADGQVLRVQGLPPEHVGELAASVGAVVFEIAEERSSLEEAFMSITSAAVQYRGQTDKVAV